uniref:Alpha-MPP n=1 Tax=Meloidogyne javanica TaxID=6303 RepID=A0A915MJV9_MELJA
MLTLSRRLSTFQLKRCYSVKAAENLKRTSNNSIETVHSVLDTGLRVASHSAYGQFCTVGVAIAAGSRFEVYYPPGTSHFVEKLSFSSTKNFEDKSKTLELMEKCGALVDCQASKDTFLYASSCRISNADEILRLIADAVLRPKILDEEVAICRDVIRYENDTLARQPEPDPLLSDWIHQAAFQSNTIGLPRYCPSDGVGEITSSHVLSYLSQYYTPNRIVVTGIGIDHDWLVDAAKELFDPRESTWVQQPERLLKNIPPLDDSLAHIFKGVGMLHEDFVPFCVLQTLMGGGGSFSAGGPGKGMFSKLYTDVLNKHYWIYNATAQYHSYTDCGLFYIKGSASPEYATKLTSILVNQMRFLSKGIIRKEDLARAKVQLKSQLLMHLEMKPVQFEDVSRQMLVYGQRKTPEEHAEQIDRVEIDDIARIADTMLTNRPSLVCYGDLRWMPKLDQVREMCDKER